MSIADSQDEVGQQTDKARRSIALDPLATVHQHPEWYFRGGLFDSDEATGLLVAEALRGGATTISVSREGGWICVEANTDWLDGDLAAFVSPQGYAEGGQNSSRVEVALVAFCRAVVTYALNEPMHSWSLHSVTVVGDGLPTEHALVGRLVAFWPPDAPDVSTISSPEGRTTRPRMTLVPNAGERAIISAVRSFVDKVQSSP